MGHPYFGPQYWPFFAAGVMHAAGVPAPGPGAGWAALATLRPASRGIVYTEQRPAAPPRLLLADWSGTARPLVNGFHGSADADVSFDGKRIVFAARRQAADPWQVYESSLDGGAPRQLTNVPGGCRQPFYQSKLFTLEVTLPWNPVACVCSGSLYSVKTDGSDFARLTWTPDEAKDPLLLSEGRVAFSSGGRLFATNLDGTDYALFALGTAAAPRMPAETDRRQVVFVEGGGTLAQVSLDRPLHSYKALSAPADGVYSSPAALAQGEILVSRKGAAGRFELWRLDPATGRKTLLRQDAAADILDARMVAPRPEPDGRGSVVDLTSEGGLALLPQRLHQRCAQAGFERHRQTRARALRPGGAVAQAGRAGPGRTMAASIWSCRRTCPSKCSCFRPPAPSSAVRAWFWVRNKEHRGCIGCHEDPELAPENREAQAIVKKPVPLVLPVHESAGGTK